MGTAKQGIKGIIKNIYLFFRQCLFFPLRFILPVRSVPDLFRIKNILVVRIDRLGDLVLTMPLVYSLKKYIPGCRITVLGNRKFISLLEDDNAVDEIIPYDSFFSVLRHLSKREFDLVIDPLFDYVLKTALLSFLLKSKWRIGFDIAGRGSFFNLRAAYSLDRKHFIDETLELLEPLGIYSDIKQPKLKIGLDRRNEVLKKYGIQSDDFIIVLHPGGHYPSQCWPAENFAKLADRIVSGHTNVSIIFTLGSGEERIYNQIKEKFAGVNNIYLLKDLNIKELAAVLSNAKLFIGNNSGPLHLACALGIPTVSTMGPTVPWRWWPHGEGHIVLRKNLSCSPCNKGVCTGHECMNMITADDVLDAVERQLKNRGLCTS
ncbi:MAG: glycosyltransferase family 9 protein [Elusimicrobia bacterium]|nr:glycosyltransferase family 9 protein [Elusimicrobiota bacterium]